MSVVYLQLPRPPASGEESRLLKKTTFCIASTRATMALPQNIMQ